MERGKQWEGKRKRKWERGKEGVGVKGRKGEGTGEERKWRVLLPNKKLPLHHC